MKCRDCSTDHPPEYTASPHYCIARLQERIEVLERQLAESRSEHVRALDGLSEIHNKYLSEDKSCHT
jgi:hypothetical protein